MTVSNLLPGALFACVCSLARALAPRPLFSKARPERPARANRPPRRYVVTLECVPRACKAVYTLLLAVLLFMRQQEVWLRPYGPFPPAPPKAAGKAT